MSDVLRIYRCRSCGVGVSTRDRRVDGTCRNCGKPFDHRPEPEVATGGERVAEAFARGRRDRYETCPLCDLGEMTRSYDRDECANCGVSFTFDESAGRWFPALSDRLRAAYESLGIDPPVATGTGEPV